MKFKIKSTVLILVFTTFINACKPDVCKEGIEKLLEISLPECYTKVEKPKVINENALLVEEIVFSEDCFDEFLNDISKQMPNAYCGTAPTRELTMVFCTRDESARMTINTETRVLHFEKLK
jgi:hypothetical protein